MTLVDDTGATVLLVAAEDEFGDILVCAREGLRENTVYTWTIGPWHEPACNEIAFEHDALDTVTFTTGDAPGEPAPDAAACSALGAARPLDDDVFSACDPNPPLDGDSGDTAGIDAS